MSRNERFLWKESSCIDSQIGVRVGHSHIAWRTVSDTWWQWSQLSSWRICLLFRFFFTGMASLHDLQMKFFTLFGIRSPQISFQILLSRSNCPWAWVIEFSVTRKLYPDFTVYSPDAVNGHTSISSAEVMHNGMLFIKLTSSGTNRPCSRFSSQLLDSGFMRSKTFKSSKPSTYGDRIRGWSRGGNQASSHTLMDFPQPTLHLAPFNNTSRPFRILCQAYEAETKPVASIIEQSGKNLDLNTQ